MSGRFSVSTFIVFFILFLPFANAKADDEVIEEIIVSASLIDGTLSELGTPLHVLD